MGPVVFSFMVKLETMERLQLSSSRRPMNNPLPIMHNGVLSWSKRVSDRIVSPFSPLRLTPLCRGRQAPAEPPRPKHTVTQYLGPPGTLVSEHCAMWQIQRKGLGLELRVHISAGHQVCLTEKIPFPEPYMETVIK